MGVDMASYEVVVACYVPVGPGIRYKRPGQVVTLSEEDASWLTGYLKPVKAQGPALRKKPKREGVAKRNTQSETVEADVSADTAGEVTSDDGDPQAGDE